MTLPEYRGDVDTIKLYKKDAKGKIRIWSIEADDFEILMEHGVLNGELQQVYEDIPEGKASRTQEEQLMLRINSKIKSRIDKGYVYSVDEAENNPVVNRLGFKKPMKAGNYKNYKHPIDLDTVIIQYKYDGHRCLVYNDGTRLIAYSTNGIEIEAIPEIIDLLTPILPVGCTLDGELYHHGTKLQTIGSWIKKKQRESQLLTYVVYDCINDGNYEYRQLMYESWLAKLPKTEKIVAAPTLPYTGSLMAMRDHAKDVWGYEGLMLRLNNSGYKMAEDLNLCLKSSGCLMLNL